MLQHFQKSFSLKLFSSFLFSFLGICHSVYADDALERLATDWQTTYTYDDDTYQKVFEGLQEVGDASLILQYHSTMNDRDYRDKLQKTIDEGVSKIADLKEVAIPYILSDLIWNASIQLSANKDFKKPTWNAPNILWRASEKRNEAIRTVLLKLDKTQVLPELESLKKKINADDDQESLLAATVNEFIDAIKAEGEKPKA